VQDSDGAPMEYAVTQRDAGEEQRGKTRDLCAVVSQETRPFGALHLPPGRLLVFAKGRAPLRMDNRQDDNEADSIAIGKSEERSGPSRGERSRAGRSSCE